MNIFKEIKKRYLNYSISTSFLGLEYQHHNIARLHHLDSLGFDFNKKTIFEFGAGIGDHTYYYLLKGAEVTSSDARKKLIRRIEKKFGIRGFVLDVEKDLEKIKKFRDYDFIHCYGLLYHIKNPADFLRAAGSTGRVLLLETCVSPDQLPVGVHLVTEDKLNPTQSKSGMGCRPSRKWIDATLRDIFPYVYYPVTQPDHKEFPLDWTIMPEQGLIRCIFIASHMQLDMNTLTTVMPVKYERIA